MASILIRNCSIIDGTGTPRYNSNILVENDKIQAIGELSNVTAETIIEADGLICSPGFIDTHTHSAGILLTEPHPANALRQGVTTEILGQDGVSYAHLSKEKYLENRTYLSGILGLPPAELDMSSIESFRTHYHKKVAINTAYLIPHGAIRLNVLGFRDKPLDKASMAHAKDLIREGISQGAVGIATGMSYFPNAWSDTQELIELCKTTANLGGVYVTHLRDVNTERAYGGGGVPEALEIGKKSGIPVHFSHFRPQEDNAGKVAERVHLIDEAKKSGVDISLELYPYPTGSTFPLSFLPSYAHEGGVNAIMERLQNPASQKRIVNYLDEESPRTLDDAVLSYVPSNTSLEGLSLKHIASERALSPGKTLCDLLVESNLQIGYWASPPMSVSIWDQINRDCMELLARDDYMVGSDSIPLGSFPHPRAYGTFPRIIGRFTRKYKRMSLEEIINRVTDKPARRFNLKHRGRIAINYFADLTLFDAEKISDRATYDDPAQFPIGIPHVIVNGEIAVLDGVCTGAIAGRAVP